MGESFLVSALHLPYRRCTCRSMALKVGALREEPAGGQARRRGGVSPDHVNRLMRCNFSVLRRLGDWALRPFLQVRALPHTICCNRPHLAVASDCWTVHSRGCVVIEYFHADCNYLRLSLHGHCADPERGAPPLFLDTAAPPAS